MAMHDSYRRAFSRSFSIGSVSAHLHFRLVFPTVFSLTITTRSQAKQHWSTDLPKQKLSDRDGVKAFLSLDNQFW